jgi:hypothetical protein
VSEKGKNGTLDKVGDIVTMARGALAMGDAAYEITRRQRYWRAVRDVRDVEDAALSAGLMGMVESGELEPYAGMGLA